MLFRTPRGALVVIALAAASVVYAGCGGRPAVAREQRLVQLSQALDAPLASSEESEQNSRLVQQVLEEDVLEGMTRAEVREQLGRGDSCARHPRCAELGFQQDDWFYFVGQMGSGSVSRVPILILGFDSQGRVARTWNLRTHDEP